MACLDFKQAYNTTEKAEINKAMNELSFQFYITVVVKRALKQMIGTIESLYHFFGFKNSRKKISTKD